MAMPRGFWGEDLTSRRPKPSFVARKGGTPNGLVRPNCGRVITFLANGAPPPQTAARGSAPKSVLETITCAAARESRIVSKRNALVDAARHYRCARTEMLI